METNLINFSGFSIKTYYEKSLKSWVGFIVDNENNNQIGECHYAVSKEHVIFYLGMEYSYYKQSFNK